MTIWNEGLNNPEIQKLHKLLKLNMNMFLQDILNDTTMFKVEDAGEHYHIYPLFYCDRIESDGDALILGTYKIVCKKDYKQIFLFISDSSIITKNTYIIKKADSKHIILIFDEGTLQPSRNAVFTIKYGEDDMEQYLTDQLGYCIFQAKNDDFEVIV